jgi:hypothetical protein
LHNSRFEIWNLFIAIVSFIHAALREPWTTGDSRHPIIAFYLESRISNFESEFFVQAQLLN